MKRFLQAVCNINNSWEHRVQGDNSLYVFKHRATNASSHVTALSLHDGGLVDVVAP